jgi:hypothetical protein
MEMLGSLFVAMWWIGSLAVTLFIIYKVYSLAARFVIASERQPRALDRFVDNFRGRESLEEEE